MFLISYKNSFYTLKELKSLHRLILQLIESYDSIIYLMSEFRSHSIELHANVRIQYFSLLV